MDPRLLLGVGARATRGSIRAAHRRLRDAVDPAAGGTSGLAALVDAASDVALTGRGEERLSVDPHAILGVRPGAPDPDIRAAYRRVALVVHPDRGGTDELFRVVATSFDVLRRTAPRRVRRPRPPSTPPPKPPPRGPYRAPDPASRHTTSRWRAWRDLAEHAAPLVLVAIVLGAAGSISAGLTLLAVVGAAAASTTLRASVEGFLRAVVVLRGSRVRVPPAVEPERFLEERCLDAPVGRQREDVLYEAYVAWCRSRGEPVAPWVFVERLRGLGLLFIKSSAWDAGLWVGVTLRR